MKAVGKDEVDGFGHPPMFRLFGVMSTFGIASAERVAFNFSLACQH